MKRPGVCAGKCLKPGVCSAICDFFQASRWQTSLITLRSRDGAVVGRIAITITSITITIILTTTSTTGKFMIVIVR